MPISTQVIGNYKRTNQINTHINKNHKFDALKDVCTSFGLELQRSNFFADKIVKNQDNNTWDNLTYPQKESLLQYLDKLHEIINSNKPEYKSLNINDIQETAKQGIKDLPEIDYLPQKLIFLIAHRDGKTHTRYATRIKIFRDFLDNDLKVCRQKLENHLDDWVKSNNNQDGYKNAKNRILECLKPGTTKLDLSKFGLNNIPTKEIFKYLTHIKELDLSYNQITKIVGDEFKALINLQKLDLRFNQITEVGKLEGLSNLTQLDLSHNMRITKIVGDEFKALINLQKLNLSINAIKEIRKLEGLSNLTQLDLKFNNITEIVGDEFEGLSNLTQLDLRFNKIPLDKLERLSKLTLAKCII